MRIAAISDLHGNIVALDAVLLDIEAQSIDTIVCLGDLAYKGPAPSECIRKIRELRIPCVYGNTDLYLLDAAGNRGSGRAALQPEAAYPYLTWHTDRMNQADLTYLSSLPLEYRLECDAQTFLFVHGTPKDCNAAIRPGDSGEHLEKHIGGVDADWIIMGHIHTPFMFRTHQKVFANTGAVGFSLDGDWRASYIVIDTADGSLAFRKVEYDIGKIVSLAKKPNFVFRRSGTETLCNEAGGNRSPMSVAWQLTGFLNTGQHGYDWSRLTAAPHFIDMHTVNSVSIDTVNPCS